LKVLVESKGSLGDGTVAKLGLMMCDVLTYLHEQTPPVVHRDFTPDNLILDQDGSLKLIDFMIAKQSEDSVTATIMGKQSYLSPEQLKGKSSTQSDIYGLGATLYFLLTGLDPEPICSSHPILACDNVSLAIDDIVSKCTDPNLEKRYGSASQVKKDLERCIELEQ
jgi:serine/threonine-protein kinase